MDPTTSLLRVAARASAATAALVARPGDEAPVAAWGCDEASGRLLLRVLRGEAEGASLFQRVPLVLADGTSAELLLVAPRPGGIDEGQLGALASQIGAACDGSVGVQTNALEQLTESIEQLGDAVAILRAPATIEESSRVVHVNAAFTRLFGYSQAELAGAGPERLYGPLTDDDRVFFLRSRALEREEARAVLVLYTHERMPVWTELSLAPITGGDQRGDFYAATFRDVTSRKQFEDALASEKRKLQTTLAAIADAVVTVLGDGRVEFVNAAAQRLLGIELVDAYGAHVGEVVPLVDAEGHAIDLLAGADHEPLRGEGHLRTKNGPMDIAYVASRIVGEDHAVVVVLRDVTAEHRLALRLSFEANHDPLTGLPNRRAFVERLEEAVRSAHERETQHAVAFLDLDRFKPLNDRFGHALGDRLLREIARVMGRVVRGADVIGRIGGDEFALLLSECSLDNARVIADKMRQVVERYRIEHQGESLGVGVSIGLAAIDATTLSAEQALSEADAACYQAKAAGRNAVAG
ncbi:MAG TPA: diguanylate cyclase [Candidatus Limnocylindria bacterium]|jgi:diguanylate cyclase (GGDEF)-like protein/PAS domain S-box-containing protein|nr:diguanylate cyclase [Candidatus Limnocylindria bacterium]